MMNTIRIALHNPKLFLRNYLKMSKMGSVLRRRR